jgi:hypothetical protein
VPQKQESVRKQPDQMLADLYPTKPEMKDRLKKAGGHVTFNPAR